MEGKNWAKYAPSKTQLTMAELKAKVAEANKALKSANTALAESIDILKRTRAILHEKEDEIRRLKLIILRMSEGKWDGNENDPR